MTQDEKDMFERLGGFGQFRRWLESEEKVWTDRLKQATPDNFQRAQGALAVIDDLLEKLTKK